MDGQKKSSRNILRSIYQSIQNCPQKCQSSRRFRGIVIFLIFLMPRTRISPKPHRPTQVAPQVVSRLGEPGAASAKSVSTHVPKNDSDCLSFWSFTQSARGLRLRDSVAVVDHDEPGACRGPCTESRRPSGGPSSPKFARALASQQLSLLCTGRGRRGQVGASSAEHRGCGARPTDHIRSTETVR